LVAATIFAPALLPNQRDEHHRAEILLLVVGLTSAYDFARRLSPFLLARGSFSCGASWPAPTANWNSVELSSVRLHLRLDERLTRNARPPNPAPASAPTSSTSTRAPPDLPALTKRMVRGGEELEGPSYEPILIQEYGGKYHPLTVPTTLIGQFGVTTSRTPGSGRTVISIVGPGATFAPGSKRNRASKVARMICACIIAKFAPTQIRGPAPKGM
jgi:hypothetical protein